MKLVHLVGLCPSMVCRLAEAQRPPLSMRSPRCRRCSRRRFHPMASGSLSSRRRTPVVSCWCPHSTHGSWRGCRRVRDEAAERPLGKQRHASVLRERNDRLRIYRVESFAPYGIDLSGKLNIRQLLLERERTQTQGGGAATIGGLFRLQGAQLIGYQRSTGFALMPRVTSTATASCTPSTQRTMAVAWSTTASAHARLGRRRDRCAKVPSRVLAGLRQPEDPSSLRGRLGNVFQRKVEVPECWPGLDVDGNLVVSQRSSEGAGRFGLYVMSTENGAIERTLYTHPNLDVSSWKSIRSRIASWAPRRGPRARLVRLGVARAAEGARPTHFAASRRRSSRGRKTVRAGS